MAKARPSRVSTARILGDLRVAAKRGDRAALTVALDAMRVLGHSPRYWDKYLALLRNPLARLVDLLVIKQGDKIAQQKAWHRRKAAPPAAEAAPRRRGPTPRSKRTAARSPGSASQATLFE